MSIKANLKEIFETRNTKLARGLDTCIQLLIGLSILSFSLETLPSLTDEQRKFLRYIEIFCIIVFTVEYIVRVWVADSRVKFCTSFSAIIDLLAILPFYLALGIDLRSIRIFRLFRLFRVLKLTKYSGALNRFHIAFKLAKEELTLFFSLTLALIYLASAGIYFFENKAQPESFSSIFDSLWWATITLTTVGYGDVYPITFGGRLFTFIILMVGLGVVSIPAGIIASALSKARQLQYQDSEK